MGAFQGVQFQIPIISKYPLDIRQNRKFPCPLVLLFSKSTKIYTDFLESCRENRPISVFRLLGTQNHRHQLQTFYQFQKYFRMSKVS